MNMLMLKKIVNSTLKAAGYGLKCACIMYCTLEYVGDVVICTGPSMEPTIESNDLIVTEHISIFKNNFKRGDVIISRSPFEPRQFICKRIVGLPGDKLSWGFSSKVVPLGHVWLEGDNKSNSSDSRSYGPVPIGLLRGRAICKVWPNVQFFRVDNKLKDA